MSVFANKQFHISLCRHMKLIPALITAAAIALSGCQPYARSASTLAASNGLLRPVAPAANVQTTQMPFIASAPTQPVAAQPLSSSATALYQPAAASTPTQLATATPIAATPAIATPAYSSTSPGSWKAAAGMTLDQVLYGWGRQAGWDVVYQANYLYSLEAGGTFTGSFEDAVSTLLTGFEHASPPLVGKLYSGNRVLVITSQETE